MFQSVVTFPCMPRKSLPPSEKRAPLGARVYPDLIESLQAIARADDRTLSYMVERAIREFVERHHGKLPPKKK